MTALQNPRLRILNVGSSAMLAETEDLSTAMGLASAVTSAREQKDSVFSSITQIVPAARSVLIQYNPAQASKADLSAALRHLDTRTVAKRTTKTVTIPVLYNGDDLQDVARLLHVSPTAVVARHTQHPWEAAFVGFAPGFAYLTGGDPLFDVPRRSSPRLKVPSGSVGLAGTFSGVYPRRSSGGWQLIGTTTLPMWDERHDPPATIQPGDTVRFRAVREQVTAGAAAGDDRGSTAGSHKIPAPVGGKREPLRDAGSSLRVKQTGLLAIFEDDGRTAAAMGVTGSGSADRLSAHLANALAGNSPADPVIEVTGDVKLAACSDVVLAIAGAPVPVIIHGDHGLQTSVASQEPFLLRTGENLEIGVPRSGMRDYLALQGGFAVNRVLGSAATDTMAHIGPRPLRPGDMLVCAHRPHRTVGSPVPWPKLPLSGKLIELEVTLGPRDEWFTARSIHALLSETWHVTPQSNRVGLRLHGERALERRHMGELASEGTVPGAVEIPNDGQPVLFLCDQPVTGGYPVIAVLTPRSRMLAAQLPPGALIRFTLADDDGRNKWKELTR